MPENYDDQLLLEYIEGDLSTEKRGQVDRWIQEDPHLALMVRNLIHDRDELRNLYDPEPPNWIMLEVDQHLERAMLLGQTRREGEQFTRHHRSALAAVMLCGALAAILAVVSTVIISILNQDKQGPDIAKVIDPTLPQRPKPENTGETPVTPPDVVAQVPVPPVVPDPLTPEVTPTPKPVVPPVAPDKPVVVVKPEVDPVVPVTPEPPVKPVPAVNASVGDAAPADMLQLPAALRPQIKDRDAVIRLSEQVIADPGLLAQYELRIATRDPVSTGSALSVLNAQVIKSGELFVLAVPADRLVHAVRTLRDDRQHAYVWFAPRSAAAKAADQAWSADWPAIKPDYANLLRRQLEAAGLLGSSSLSLPVVITRASAGAASDATPLPSEPVTKNKPGDAAGSAAKKIKALIEGMP